MNLATFPSFCITSVHACPDRMEKGSYSSNSRFAGRGVFHWTLLAHSFGFWLIGWIFLCFPYRTKWIKDHGWLDHWEVWALIFFHHTLGYCPSENSMIECGISGYGNWFSSKTTGSFNLVVFMVPFTSPTIHILDDFSGCGLFLGVLSQWVCGCMRPNWHWSSLTVLVVCMISWNFWLFPHGRCARVFHGEMSSTI